MKFSENKNRVSFTFFTKPKKGSLILITEQNDFTWMTSKNELVKK